ncbi:hypothetical protein J6590_033230 [Homalodisca vitripennis]|nr:hypothetical protein J6590_033230 [Homalodisca vitripennis]
MLHEGQRDLLELTVPSKSKGGGVGALALSLRPPSHRRRARTLQPYTIVSSSDTVLWRGRKDEYAHSKGVVLDPSPEVKVLFFLRGVRSSPSHTEATIH